MDYTRLGEGYLGFEEQGDREGLCENDDDQTSHLYSEEIAQEGFQAAVEFLGDARFLLAQLKQRIE